MHTHPAQEANRHHKKHDQAIRSDHHAFLVRSLLWNLVGIDGDQSRYRFLRFLRSKCTCDSVEKFVGAGDFNIIFVLPIIFLPFSSGGGSFSSAMARQHYALLWWPRPGSNRNTLANIGT